MSEQRVKTQAFKLKGRLYTFTVLQVLSDNPVFFAKQLEETVAKAPKLFDRTPIVLDLSLTHDMELDIQGLCQMAREKGIIPVAVQGANGLQETIAQCHGLAILNASTTQDKSLMDATIGSSPTLEPVTAKLITTPVRSGQQIVAKGCDLIITAAVSHGAELLADGNIHVYGALRGRALAGISGDVDARIYCQSLEAELVAVAGFYRLSDAIDSVSGGCQIYLHQEHIIIESL
jgi:septum site-determining protein MinC